FQGLNKQSAHFDRHPTFGLLLREWHRGNFDHIHSWIDDMVPQYSYELPTPVILNNTKLNVPLKSAPWMNDFEKLGGPNGRGYQQLHLFFERAPPDDLRIGLHFVNGDYNEFPAEIVRNFRAGRSTATEAEASITLILNEGWPFGVTPPGQSAYSPLAS